MPTDAQALQQMARVLNSERARILKALHACHDGPGGVGQHAYVGIVPADRRMQYSLEVWFEDEDGGSGDVVGSSLAADGDRGHRRWKASTLVAISFHLGGDRTKDTVTGLFPLWLLVHNANNTRASLNTDHLIGSFIRWRDYELSATSTAASTSTPEAAPA